MLPLQFDAKLRSPRGAIEKGLALVPVRLALATGVIALLQVVNGLPAETVIETLIVGWLLATPVAALVLWPLPDAVPVPSLGTATASADDVDADAEDPVQVLRDRYATGEIGQEEFERRLDDLLATEERDGDDSLATGPSDGPKAASDRLTESE